MTNQNFEIFAGDSKVLSAQVFVEETTTPKAITGATVRWVVYNKFGQTILDRSSTGPTPAIALTDAGNGRFEITIQPVDTETLTPGLYRHEAEVTDASSRISTVFTGTMLVKLSKA